MLLALCPATVTIFARGAALATAPMDARMTAVRTRRRDGGWHVQSVRRRVGARQLSRCLTPTPLEDGWGPESAAEQGCAAEAEGPELARRPVSSSPAGARLVSPHPPDLSVTRLTTTSVPPPLAPGVRLELTTL
jgi:hypothetical protein